MHRIVVTGIGVLSSIGTGKSFWGQLLEGTNGIREVMSFDTSEYRVHRGGEIHDFDPAEYVHRQNPHQMGRTSQLAIAAAKLALEDAGIDEQAINDRYRIGVATGTTTGEAPVIERFNDCLVQNQSSSIDPKFVNTYPCHSISVHVAREFRIGGTNLVLPCACAAGNYAIASASDALRSGQADLMLAGGADAFSRITYAGFARLNAISPDVCRPFDKNRRGMIPGEGAAMLVLEPLAKAVDRKTHIYAEVTGYGLSCDAHHMTAAHPEAEGASRAMRQALRNSRMNADEVDYISAHGTGTRLSDRLETKAVKRVFDESAYRIPVSSIKSMLGHTMGAASAIEAAACAMAVDRNRVPPTINWETRDDDCDLDYVTSGARECIVKTAMSNAYAFGGYNASIVLSKARI